MALVAASVAWTWWTARVHGGQAAPVVALQLGCAGAYVAARVASQRLRPLVPVLMVSVVAAVVVLKSTVPSLDPVGLPLGYANANAALYVLVAVAAAMVAAAFPPGPAWAVMLPVAAAFALAAVVSGSMAGMVAIGFALMLAAGLLARSARVVVVLCAVVVQATVGATAALGVAAAGEGPLPGFVGRAADVIDERRIILWAHAANMTGASPVDGVGPGRFRRVSPLARMDPDARWAHSGFFQQGAEQGGVGLALLLGAFGWGFARLALARPPDAFTALGAVALGVLGLHASVDYVLHFALVPPAAAALVGAASVSPLAPTVRSAPAAPVVPPAPPALGSRGSRHPGR